MSEIFELSRFERAEALERPVVLPFTPAELKENFGRVVQTPKNRHAPTTPLPLIKKLCEALNAQQVSYCQWKSNWRLHKWLTGEGDLDLLVDRSDAQRFVNIVRGLGFKQAEPSSDRQVPGILNFYGLDTEAGRLVHLHVHYQLVVGHDLTKNYHLPVETLYLENTIRQGIIPIPAPDVEIIFFALRMVLKFSWAESVMRKLLGKNATGKALSEELDYLESHVDRARVANLLQKLTPTIDHRFFNTCLASLRPNSSSLQRWLVRHQLQKRLESCARRPRSADALSKVYRHSTRLVRERMFNRKARKQFVDGGLLVALVGGDGSGKTTTLSVLNAWLSKKFLARTFHLGKPPRSPITLALIVLLRIYRLLTNTPAHPAQSAATSSLRFPGYLQLLRWVSAGRDRSRLYVKARRFATNGGIAVCDRYPVAQLQLMDGPNIARTVPPPRRNKLVKSLLKLETHYYQKIMQPDVLIVLRVNPEIAVQRKTTEHEAHVRTRSSELWKQDWSGTNAYVINTEQPLDKVIAQAKSIIWGRL